MYYLRNWRNSWIILLAYLFLVFIHSTDANCKDPPFIPNASPLQSVAESGNRVTYRCDDGFELVNGPAEILCQENNLWTNVEFHCKAPGCPDPTLIPNARPMSTHERFTGARVVYECDQGFTLENGPAELVCMSHGVWTKPNFECKAGIVCLQCNVFVQGTTNNCDNPKMVSNCYACLKTSTKVRMHDRWGVLKTSEAMSRYCIQQVSSAIYREEGCYVQRNNGGFTERCYCYSDRCNGVGIATFSLATVLMGILAYISATQ